jgi:ABC-type uncharacterized transport system auxiliary subunit
MSGASLRVWRASLLLFAFLSGCISIERSYPERHYFVLDIGRNEKSIPIADQTLNGILEVSDLRISPRYQGQSFVYRISEAGYESDFYNQFLVAPAVLVTEEVRKALAESRVFAYVINSASQLPTTHRLEGTVNALYGDFRAGGAGRAVLEMEFFLTRPSRTGTEIIMDKRYLQSVPLSRRSPEALVKGWDEALQAILTSLVADLKSAKLQQEVRSPTPPAAHDKGKSDEAGSR